MALTGDTMSTTESVFEQRILEIVADATGRIAAEMDPVCPTSTYLTTLSREVEMAQADPASVAHPELVDAETYWEVSVKPQGAALRSTVSEILEWLEAGVVSMMGAAESELKALVDTSSPQPGADTELARQSLEHQVNARCLELHHLMAEVLRVVPTSESLDEARTFLSDQLRSRATSDVDSLKDAYMSGAGGDDQHQQFAQKQWSDTHADRVSHREALLQAEPPWRHQEMALVGHERTQAAVAEMVEAVVERLQAPLSGMSRPLMERYDAPWSQ